MFNQKRKEKKIEIQFRRKDYKGENLFFFIIFITYVMSQIRLVMLGIWVGEANENGRTEKSKLGLVLVGRRDQCNGLCLCNKYLFFNVFDLIVGLHFLGIFLKKFFKFEISHAHNYFCI